MRTTVALASTLLALTAAQQYTAADIPQCALTCFGTAITSSDCGLTDTECQCTTGQEAITQALVPCLCQSDCSASDLEMVTTVSNSICSQAVDNYQAPPPPSADACGDSASSSGSSSGATSSGSAAPAGTSAAAPPVASESMSMSMGATESAVASASASASQAVEQQTGNGAAPMATGIGMLGAAALGLLAL